MWFWYMDTVRKEVFILKTEDLNRAMEDIYSDTTRYFLENFYSIQSIEDLRKLYKEHPDFYIFCDLPVWMLREYEVSGNTEKILIMFGQKLESLEEKENKKRKNLSNQTQGFKDLIGFSTAEFSEKFWGPHNELLDWLEKNGSESYKFFQF